MGIFTTECVALSENREWTDFKGNSDMNMMVPYNETHCSEKMVQVTKHLRESIQPYTSREDEL